MAVLLQGAYGHFGELIGSWVKFGLPSRLSWVSR